MSKNSGGRDSDTEDPISQAPLVSSPLTSGEKPTRKNHYLYQSKIDMAREILGARTETEALDAALDLLIYGEALARGTEEMFGEEYNDVLGIADEAPEPSA